MSKILNMLEELGAKIDFISYLKTREDAGNPCGDLNGNKFYITFQKTEQEKYLLLTLGRNDGIEITTEPMKRLMIQFMDAEPICSYREKNPDRITFEWDLIDPESRLKEIVNGGGTFAKQEIFDIKLFGDRKLEDYVDEEEKKKNLELEKERIKNARIYGSDPGTLDPEKVAKMDEWELFLSYYSITFIAWQMDHNGSRDFSRGFISVYELKRIQKKLEELQYPIEYLLYTISKKIGVPVNEPKVDEHIEPDRKEFMKWYEYYNNHFNYVLSDGQRRELEERRRNGGDIAEFSPTGNWREAV